MPERVDLHVHSNYSSDGEWEVERLFKAAEALPLAAFSISDHDTVAALPEAFQRAKSSRLRYFPNVEISTGYDRQTFHLLAPMLKWQHRDLEKFLAGIRQARYEQTIGRVEKLRELGFVVNLDAVLEKADEVGITGPAIAKLVLENEANRSDSRLEPYKKVTKESPAVAFYTEYMKQGGPAYVARRKASLLEAIQLVRRLGGLPVLAHPGKESDVDSGLLKTLKDAGLEGLEVYTPYHDQEQQRYFLDLAHRFDLIATTGSDFHGQIKPLVELGSVPESEGLLRAMAERKGRL